MIPGTDRRDGYSCGLNALVVTVHLAADIRGERVEWQVQITIDRPTPTEPVCVKIVQVEKAPTQPPAVIKAFSAWIAEGVTTLPFEKAKEGLPSAGDTWHITATTDFIDDANDKVHELVGGAVEDVAGDVAGMTPGWANAAGRLMEYSEFPQDDLLEKTVKPLRR